MSASCTHTPKRVVRFLLTVDRPTPSGKGTYRHIMHVGEYNEDFGPVEKMRRRFRDICRRNCPQGYNDPTKRIDVEYHTDTRWDREH